ncbi:autotransporter outer membrane beta-barrel domain-containing protein [Pseudomonas marincola]|uniref:autotransporter outer membrane beta-barrel domain-containing protein n=1 Tax=Pseudomonas marincola TaxID=437900 RepID=UPI003001F2AB
MTAKYSASKGLLITALMLSTPMVYAAKCKTPGGLAYLGTSANQQNSIWVSGTGSGTFALEAPGNTVVDTWDKSQRGLHISISPIVSQGNGLPHTLIDTTGEPCDIDTENQKGGITFPPIVQLPPKLPPILRPPSGRPSLPGLMPSRPGTQPPATGITPSLPMGVTPPIATLPPTGLTPTAPGAVVPPTGTLPPTGITPSVPMGVTPPIATLPPTGLTPTAPGAVIPPAGTLPPTTGITPSVPMGVTPPIATLPPTDLTPTAPGNNASLPDGIDYSPEVPLTEGRRFTQEPGWNLWVDSRFSDISDRRSGLDLDGKAGYVTIGADHRLNQDLAVGLMTIFERNRSSGFNDEWKVRSDGFSVGPYVAYRLNPQWSIDSSLGIGVLNNENQISVLKEEYETQRYALSMSATGQYNVDEVLLQPKFSLSYTHFRNEDHLMKGNVLGTPVTLNIEQQNFNYGVVESSLQISRGYTTDDGKVWFPFAEVGLNNEFDRPNDGLMITGDLSQEKSSAWTGTLRTGMQALLTPNTYIETSVGYLSLGQNGLDIWEGRLFFSYGF